MAARSIPDGFHAVTPYLLVADAARLICFLEQAFGAVITERVPRPDGGIMHAQARIGDSMVMMGEPGERHPPMPACLYLYVADADATYARALQAGAISMTEPTDQFYGDRSAGVKDPADNIWWIATRIEDVAPEELAKRARAAMAERATG